MTIEMLFLVYKMTITSSASTRIKLELSLKDSMSLGDISGAILKPSKMTLSSCVSCPLPELGISQQDSCMNNHQYLL